MCCATPGYAIAPGSLFRINSPQGIRIIVNPLTDHDIEPLSAANPAAPTGPSR
uniref:hypothetical protein n=1 Tax=Paractinoplanes polyasparticus TaxID=2856853 RepID=UPI0021085A8E|nr:hypothetical protein [Actinoplanes polyasparticus]